MDPLRQSLKGVAKEVSKKVGKDSIVGLGSGSTVAALLEELAPLVMAKHSRMGGVTTSTQIELVASRSGVTLMPFKGWVDIVLDGADQVDSNLNLVKGGGGALLREKVVMGSAKEVVVVAAANKFVKRLCQNGGRIPVEVVPMARESAKVKLSMLGGVPEERLLPKGYPYFTENGNIILDTLFEPVEDPRELESRVKSVPGVVEAGIFTFKPITVYKLMAGGEFEELAAK